MVCCPRLGRVFGLTGKQRKHQVNGGVKLCLVHCCGIWVGDCWRVVDGGSPGWFFLLLISAMARVCSQVWQAFLMIIFWCFFPFSLLNQARFLLYCCMQFFTIVFEAGLLRISINAYLRMGMFYCLPLLIKYCLLTFD
jgi:hypothetical protein